MEKRLLLAIVLSFLILFLYQALFVKREAPPDYQQDTPSVTEQKPYQEPLESIPKQKEEEAALMPSEQEEFKPISESKEEEVIVNTALYYARWSNKGAALKSWKLKKHKDENGDDLELVSFSAEEINKYPFFLLTDDAEFDQTINTALYKPSITTLELGPGEEGEIRFHFADNQGNRVEKILIFKDGSYAFDIQLNVWKNGQKITPYLIWGPKIGNPSAAEQRQRFGGSSGISVYSAAKVFRHEEKKYDPSTSTYNFINWAAYDNQYFATLFIATPQKSSALFIQEEINQFPYFFLASNYINKAYIGPKSFDTLSELGYEAQRVVRFGFFGVIAQILYRTIKIVHNAIPNWGFCIIILTLAIKIVFFPLTYSSTKSMAKMQELQPKIKALKAKYKKAKQDIEQRRKLNEETMRLYKEHGINPAGGCLPMLIQLPIFWGFFRLLVTAVEFRHSPFILWINDLSVKDPYYITPLLMGATQFISQKMTPTSGDPTQQRMMLIMPVIMTVFFMNFQSGLVLYWLTNNVLQIGQQYIMNRIAQKKKRELHGRKRKK